MVKLKPKNISKIKRRKQVSAAEPRSPAADSQDDPLLEVWETELKLLKSEKFSSIDDALNAVVSAVLAKLGPDANPEEREFVEDLLRTDPLLMEALSKQLVRGS